MSRFLLLQWFFCLVGAIVLVLMAMYGQVRVILIQYREINSFYMAFLLYGHAVYFVSVLLQLRYHKDVTCMSP